MATAGNHPDFSVRLEPLSWQQIVLDKRREPDGLPFLAYFAELDDAGGDEERAMRVEDLMKGDRIVEPVEGWQRFVERSWGEDQRMIEEWFDEGEELQHRDLELEIDELDRWGRALQWVRSLAVATRLIPA